MKTLIGLMGFRHNGKSTTAELLCSELGFLQLDFVEPIRNMICETLGWDGDRDQDLVCPRWGISMRDALLEFGRVGRKLHHEFWIQRTIEAAQNSDPFPYVVIPHVRTISEIAAIRRAGGVVWRVLLSGHTPNPADPLEYGQLDLRCDRTFELPTVEQLSLAVLAEARKLCSSEA